MSRTRSRAATSFAPPSKAELARAAGRRLPDRVRPGLKVLFCGINPGLYSAATGWHFARPGNRFYPALFAAGITPRLLHPSEGEVLVELGYGLTNLVSRATAAADELRPDELVAGKARLLGKLRRYRPRIIAFLGMGAYRTAFGVPQARLGPQMDALLGTRVWVLPSPSGLNASYQLKALAGMFRRLRKDAESIEAG